MSPALQRDELSLPARETLAYTGAEDPLEYYYRRHTAWMYRARLRLALETLGNGPFESLIEVGYGSGILLPELTQRARRVCGVDVHPYTQEVERSMERLGVTALLRQASLFEMPFAEDEFDVLVCLSVLEHIKELDVALEEVARVLRPSGVAVIGFPVRNVVTDGLFRALGYQPREMHPSSHDDIIQAAVRSTKLDLERIVQIPRKLPRSVSAYVVLRLLRTSGTLSRQPQTVSGHPDHS